jgi:hypothetical protein
LLGPGGIQRLAGCWALVAVVAVYAIISWTQPTPAARARALQESADRSREVEQKAAKALEALKSSPSPAPVVQPKPASTPAGVVPVQAPRAMLVKLPLPRAQLVKLPERKIDEARLLLMPYGQQVVGTLRGFLGSEAQLPRIGHIGDTWIVNNVRWIWITEPGTSAPTWVDP